jgi:hypothetical protein
MGTFAETAKVYNRLSFADQGKLTSVFRIYICTETAAYTHIDIDIYIYKDIFISIYVYMLPFQMETEANMIFLYPRLRIAHRANGSYLFANGLKGLNGPERLWT